jgi:hypothetical protein
LVRIHLNAGNICVGSPDGRTGCCAGSEFVVVDYFLASSDFEVAAEVVSMPQFRGVLCSENFALLLAASSFGSAISAQTVQGVITGTSLTPAAPSFQCRRSIKNLANNFSQSTTSGRRTYVSPCA